MTKAARIKSLRFAICVGSVFAAIFVLGAGALPASASGPTITIRLDAPIVGMAPSASGTGYWLVGSDGGIFSFGDASFYGSMGGKRLDAPVIGIAQGPMPGGYWLAASDGGIFSFGSSHFFGSMGGKRLDEPVVGIASTPDHMGYWLVASDGGVFSFGDAHFYGSMGGKHLDAPIVGITSSPNGDGYWLVASDGGVFSFGDASFHGSMGGRRLLSPITSIASDNATGGYWMAAADGGVFSFGAPYVGSKGSHPPSDPVRSIVGASKGNGYWLSGDAGAIYNFGSAQFEGQLNGILPKPPPTTSSPDAIASRITAIADSQINQTDPYLYGPIGVSWCAYFATWVWQRAGLDIPSYPLAYQVGAWALEHGGTLIPPSATPQIGDAVLYEPPWSSMAWPDEGGLGYPNIEHVNIVVAVLPGNQIITVGGDESGGVREMGPYSAANASSWWGQAIYGFVQPPGA